MGHAQHVGKVSSFLLYNVPCARMGRCALGFGVTKVSGVLGYRVLCARMGWCALGLGLDEVSGVLVCHVPCARLIRCAMGFVPHANPENLYGARAAARISWEGTFFHLVIWGRTPA